ncbi:hypothetical protein RhiirA4_488817 [Rhizophagus irregularis]|uniref:Uncharacterized protein n=1 Tax=Rhizophagus irregularis TaxID=588596 RepID=A0A2I1HU58_9GLOM|nr:hypothetical protein RhiirA4_488817 [Rhizophagus irregularis]
MLIGPLEDNRQIARSNVHTSQEKQKQRYDAQISSRQYAIGEQVLLKNFRPKKLDTKWNGPYYIHDRRNNGTYQLRTIDGKIRAHVSMGDDVTRNLAHMIFVDI